MQLIWFSRQTNAACSVQCVERPAATRSPSVLSPGLEVNWATSTILTANCCPVSLLMHRRTTLKGPLVNTQPVSSMLKTIRSRRAQQVADSHGNLQNDLLSSFLLNITFVGTAGETFYTKCTVNLCVCVCVCAKQNETQG